MCPKAFFFFFGGGGGGGRGGLYACSNGSFTVWIEKNKKIHTVKLPFEQAYNPPSPPPPQKKKKKNALGHISTVDLSRLFVVRLYIYI